MTQAADERNYHVFYELLKGLRTEEKERYGLTAAENYFYLNQVYVIKIAAFTKIELNREFLLFKREDIVRVQPSMMARISKL